jgi:hypothetical protein
VLDRLPKIILASNSQPVGVGVSFFFLLPPCLAWLAMPNGIVPFSKPPSVHAMYGCTHGNIPGFHRSIITRNGTHVIL